MDLTDACVFPYPAGDSSLRRLAIEAGELGLTGIVAIGEGLSGGQGSVSVIPGALIRETLVKGLLAELRRMARDAQIVLVNAGDNAFNRTAITQRRVQVIRHVHKAERDAFDHVTARMAADRGVAVDLSLRPLIQMRGSARQKVLQRYREIMVLQRRFRFPLTISSNALSVLEQRSVREMTGLCSLFGMTEEEVLEALGTIGRILDGARPVRVVA
jgi:ribonuclease P/MRP protein subunit RPP1